MTNTLDDTAILALLVRHADAWFERQRINLEIEQAKKRVEYLNSRIADCDTSFRVFGFDVNKDGVWSDLVERYKEDLKPYIAQFSNGAPDDDEGSAQELIPPPEQPPIHHLVLDRLKDAGEKGSKAAPIRAFVEGILRRPIHEKTVGMTLYRLLQKGLVRRAGHTWFFVPQIAETENPGGSAPGHNIDDLLGRGASHDAE